MQDVLCTERAGAPLAGTRAAGPAARLGIGQPPQTSGQRWRAFALLVVAYFITIVDFTIVNVAHTLVHHGYAAPAALTGGFQLALWVCGVTGLLAVPAAVLLIRHTERPGGVSIPRTPEVAMATAGE